MSAPHTTARDVMTPTEIDRELGALSSKMLLDEADEQDYQRYQELLERRARQLVTLPVVRSRYARRGVHAVSSRSLVAA